MRHIVPHHILELTLEVILELTLEVILDPAWDKDHDIFNPGSCSDGLSLPRN